MRTLQNLVLASVFLSSVSFAVQEPRISKNYRMSVIDGEKKANEVYNNLRDDDRSVSQCFYRAHTWCNQMDRSCQLKTAKIFIFYTPRYQKEVDGKWWFHVAPLVHVKSSSSDEIMEYVFDKTFNVNVTHGTDKPVTISNWVNHFSHGKPCKVMENFQEFLDEREKPVHAQTYCYIRKTPMYAWSPADIEENDCANPPRERTHWDINEIKRSEKAFGTGNRFGYFFERVLGL